MKPIVLPAGLAALTLALATFTPRWTRAEPPDSDAGETDALRAAYSLPRDQWPKPTLDPGVEHRELGPVPAPVHPSDNPHSKAKADLGKLLFFDARLSGSKQLACASCHEPELGWSDGRTVSFGNEREPLKRNAPSLNNAAHRTSLFWDGRAPTLEAQAAEVILNPHEMEGSPPDIVAALSADTNIVAAFRAAFGDTNIVFARIPEALATYQRTIVSRPSEFERFLSGKTNALSDAAVRGLHLFRTQARCLNCHNGPLLTDEKFHDLGLSYYGRELEDLGRYRVTTNAADVGAFRTPSLRNVARTAPYMHNGLFDLDGVINLYNAGMPTLKRKEHQKNDPLFPTKSHLLQPLGLTSEEKADLKAFLESLTETRLRVPPPPGAFPATR